MPFLFYNRIWGIGTGIGAIVFEWVAPFVTGLPFVAAIAGKVSWLGKALPKMFASAAGGGTDQSIIDFLKGQFSWKKTAVVAGLCFVFALGGKYIGNCSDDIIKWINNRNVPNLEQLFISNNGNALSSTVPKRVGDTPFGRRLQKFASNSSGKTGSKTTSKSFEYKITKEEAEKALQGYTRFIEKKNRVLYDNSVLNREYSQSMVVKQKTLDHLSDKQLIYNFKFGLAPRNPRYGSGVQGRYELHHWEQRESGPLLELPFKLHKKSYSKLHPLGNQGGIGANRPGWDQFRKDYWRARYIEELIRRGYKFPLELD